LIKDIIERPKKIGEMILELLRDIKRIYYNVQAHVRHNTEKHMIISSYNYQIERNILYALKYLHMAIYHTCKMISKLHPNIPPELHEIQTEWFKSLEIYASKLASESREHPDIWNQLNKLLKKPESEIIEEYEQKVIEEIPYTELFHAGEEEYTEEEYTEEEEEEEWI